MNTSVESAITLHTLTHAELAAFKELRSQVRHELLSAQKSWAEKHVRETRKGGITGPYPNMASREPVYFNDWDDNLFRPLIGRNFLALKAAGGRELVMGKHFGLDVLPEIQAAHSSAALCVNTFQYWQNNPLRPTLVEALGFEPTRVEVERIDLRGAFPVSLTGEIVYPDVVINCRIDGNDAAIAVECKFAEPYKDGETVLEKEYIHNKTLWRGMEPLYDIAVMVAAGRSPYLFLDAAQLIKHLLGLKSRQQSAGTEVRMVYLHVMPEDARYQIVRDRIREEIDDFAEHVSACGIQFGSLTLRKLFSNMAHNGAVDETYLAYNNYRYLS